MTQYLIFFLAFAASAALPGPEIAALLARSISGGISASLPLAIGIVIGKLLMLTAAVIGLSALLAILGPAFVALKYIGAAYLVWLGIKKWRKAGAALAAETSAPATTLGIEIGLGLAMTVTNPLAIAFYMALLPGVINVSGITLSSYLILCSIIVGVMCSVVLGYGMVGELARKMFRSSRAKANVERASGTMMIGVGVMLATR
ncbi:Threonine/homoserine/homoserine lactone efflux protein [Collimonas sp. OK307]|uniref:LysE family translocator n=1 Tax=Collimonas sp. OK307 TaxID=1801620 RepID=UPI0008EE9595|nr:LysE family translocator [Collimonas sp. OK307]SFI30313.1 Threonine/homoserine/homoserine lactone efflux protein [Collimonas sp. OK307]